jgi:alkanesulfonate monooxygenase SsuD/methylene tetrahydromethanopterin reductase-like flavin-dependent oxidoreductase (luciferase family)
MANILVQPSIFKLVPQPRRVLLLNAPAVDLRLPWARWHQPVGLLQIGAVLRKMGCDVRFLDCLLPDPNDLPTRTRVGSVEADAYRLNLWRFGMPWPHLANHIRCLKQDGWSPDMILVSCLTTSWWQGAQELVRCLTVGLDGRPPLLPGVPVILGGAYPTLAPDHAARYCQPDVVVAGSIPEACAEVPWLELYAEGRRPRFAGLYLYQSQGVSDTEAEVKVVPRSPEEVADEVAHKSALGVIEFAFFDEEIRLSQREHFLEVLDAIARRQLKIRLVAVGNISPCLIDATVARAMGRAGYRQVYLKCEVTLGPHGAQYDTPYDTYQACAAALHEQAGFKSRTDQLTAMLLVGTPYENIETIAERAIRLASIVGSVNLVPYQYSPGIVTGRLCLSLLGLDNSQLDLTALNCKLYPLARRSGIPYQHYVELTRLAALLNAKFHSTTFDFLGDGSVARAVQASLARGTWHPDRSHLPADETRAEETRPIQPLDWSHQRVKEHRAL